MWSGTALILLLSVTLSVCSAIVNDDGAVILPIDSYSPQDKDRLRVNASLWPGQHESYAGYIQVDADKDINLFFWLCLAKAEKRQNAPMLLWLNGGPGLTSFIGALLENGPFQLLDDGTVVEREHAWTNEFHMVYIDSPVGVGFSYSSLGTVQDKMEDVIKSLYKLIKHLHMCIFPEYFKNGLYIGGQSYAGKYIPHLGQLIHQKNELKHEKRRIPLLGMYLGNAFCDPENMFPVYPDSLYHAGLLSSSTRETYRRDLQDMIRESTEKGGLFNTSKYLDIIFGAPSKGLGDLSHLFSPEFSMDKSFEALQVFMNKSSIALALNAGHLSQRKFGAFNLGVREQLLKTDLLHSTAAQNKLLMDNYKVMQYTGHLDMLVTVAMTDVFLDNVDWAGRELLRQAAYKQWSAGGHMAGWYATVGNFTRVIVRQAGHNVPYDQPRSSLEMITRFVQNGFN